MAILRAWVCLSGYGQVQVIDLLLLHRNHFCLAIIHFPPNPDGEYLIYCFDSMQDEMDEDVRYAFAMLLTEREHCDVKATSAAYNHSAVDEFLATRMRFIHVKVRCVFVLSFVWVYELMDSN
jgi:hypothetical protein